MSHSSVALLNLEEVLLAASLLGSSTKAIRLSQITSSATKIPLSLSQLNSTTRKTSARDQHPWLKSLQPAPSSMMPLENSSSFPQKLIPEKENLSSSSPKASSSFILRGGTSLTTSESSPARRMSSFLTKISSFKAARSSKIIGTSTIWASQITHMTLNLPPSNSILTILPLRPESLPTPSTSLLMRLNLTMPSSSILWHSQARQPINSPSRLISISTEGNYTRNTIMLLREKLLLSTLVTPSRSQLSCSRECTFRTQRPQSKRLRKELNLRRLISQSRLKSTPDRSEKFKKRPSRDLPITSFWVCLQRHIITWPSLMELSRLMIQILETSLQCTLSCLMMRLSLTDKLP